MKMQRSYSAYNSCKTVVAQMEQQAKMVNLVCAMLLALICSCSNPSRYEPPLSPEESMKTFQFSGDFSAEIFAAEPHVVDPVGLEFDEDGNAWVVTMPDAYKPDSVKGKCQILLLKDMNQDGRVDSSVVFADSIREASSILPWQGGLLIAAAPNIMFYKDTDGDGRADYKEIVFTGFFTGNEEAQITNLRLSVDNWIYANNTGQAGEVIFNRKPEAAKLLMRGADFRFRLDRNEFELASGPGQFGLAIDDWGQRYFTTNSVHISQAVIPRRYLDRNPFIPGALKTSSVNISDHDLRMYQLSATPYWRQERTNRRNKDFRENNMDRVEYARDHFTGASGGTYFGSDVYGDTFYGNVFTGDVAGSLVHRDELHPSESAPHMIARRPKEETDKEFLATKDSWFRPAGFSVGPDGYLYVIDMYRQHIETPLSIPDDLETDMDFDAGNDMGRIYRIVRSGMPDGKPVVPALSKATNVELLSLLSHKIHWWRLQAQRLLLDRRDPSIVDSARLIIQKSNNPQARLHALYILEGMNALTAAFINAALQDSEAGVRQNAIQLAEQFPTCLPQLHQMATDTSARVRFQLALSLGAFNDSKTASVLAKLLQQNNQDKWLRAAILTSEIGSSIELLKALSSDSFFDGPTDWKQTFCKQLFTIIGNRNKRTDIKEAFQLLQQPAVNKTELLLHSCLEGLAEGWDKISDLNTKAKDDLKTIKSSKESTSQLLSQLKIWHSENFEK